MEYREIVSVTGLGGLYHLLTTKSDGAIVRNLADKSTKFISARVHQVTPLESIEVYGSESNLRLHEVLQRMKDQEGTVTRPGNKAGNDEIKAYFDQAFPEFDEQRVYVSDKKKMLRWYEILRDNDLLNFDYLKDLEANEEAGSEAAPSDRMVATETAAADQSNEALDTMEEAAPAKKTAKKKTAEE